MWDKIKKFFGFSKPEILPEPTFVETPDIELTTEESKPKKVTELLTSDSLTKLSKGELQKLAKKRFSLNLKLAETKKQMIDKILTKQVKDETK